MDVGAGRAQPLRLAALVAFAAATVLLIPLELWLPGGAAFLACAALAWRTGEPAFRRRMGVLLTCVGVLALAPVNTDTSTLHFLTLGLPFLAVVLGPAIILNRTDPGVLSSSFIPKRLSRLELGYVVLSVPLAWAGLRLYFGLSPEIPRNWALPPEPTSDSLVRLFLGINAVGVWDELFFVNTVFAVLRSLFSFWPANLGQSVVYTVVLYDMAFRGWGPAFVLALALTQGIMFERSRSLLYVLLVHLIVDYWLFQEIVDSYYPGFSAWWHPSF